MAKIVQIDQTELSCTLKELPKIQFVRVDQTSEEPLWDELMRSYHYLGYRKMIGQRLKYLVQADGRIIAAISFNRPARHVAVRDDYIGWDESKLLRNLNYIS